MAPSGVERRKRVWVHPGVQGFLVLRVLCYLGAAAVFVLASLILWQLAVRGPARLFHNHLADIWRQYAPVFVALGVLVPFFLYDMIRVSHRFMGPIYRLHCSLEALAQGKPVEPIRFRKDDLLQELAEPFNQLLQRMEQLQRQAQVKPSDAAQSASAPQETMTTSA